MTALRYPRRDSSLHASSDAASNAPVADLPLEAVPDWRAVPDGRRIARRGCRGGRRVSTAEAQRPGGAEQRRFCRFCRWHRSFFPICGVLRQLRTARFFLRPGGSADGVVSDFLAMPAGGAGKRGPASTTARSGTTTYEYRRSSNLNCLQELTIHSCRAGG